jgi:hypothetical protein
MTSLNPSVGERHQVCTSTASKPKTSRKPQSGPASPRAAMVQSIVSSLLGQWTFTMGRRLDGNEIKLTARDYFLLGMLAETAKGRDWLPHGCSDHQAKELAQGGYLERAATRAGNGREIVRYRITAKGRAAWRAHGFIKSPAEARME